MKQAKKIFLIAMLSLFISCPILGFSLMINIFSVNNGKGLESDRQILKKALLDLGHIVFEKNLNEKRTNEEPCVDINVFFETLKPDWFSVAHRNWFIPNPEWYTQNKSLLNEIDLILCRTHEVEKIFKPLHRETFFLGFSSRDHWQSHEQKNFSEYAHLAGGSGHKGTEAVVDAWRNDQEMPHLTIVRHNVAPWNQKNITWFTNRLPLQTFLDLQNRCGIHLCPSKVEGFGHYIMEAMSTKAVVITTDAPPMNEFITDKRCLVPYIKTSALRLGTNYHIDSADLKKTIQYLQSLPESELEMIGENNRAVYLQKTEEFHDNLIILMQSAMD